jgi:hypothetical protein
LVSLILRSIEMGRLLLYENGIFEEWRCSNWIW